MLPNGMFFGHLFGPEEGHCNDNNLLAKSKILKTCTAHAVQECTDENTPAQEIYLQIFGDPAYEVSNQIISPYSGAGDRTEEEREWNAEMAAVRIEVEHGFGTVLNTWPFLNTGWKMHVYRSPCRRYYHAGVLFTNALNCMSYNQVAQYFNCEPPSLLEYFHN
jgi:nuclease HARBI1